MIINVNNKREKIPENSTVMDLLELMNLKNGKVSVWVNGNQLLMREYDNYELNDEDKVKILRVVGGG